MHKRCFSIILKISIYDAVRVYKILCVRHMSVLVASLFAFYLHWPHWACVNAITGAHSEHKVHALLGDSGPLRPNMSATAYNAEFLGLGDKLQFTMLRQTILWEYSPKLCPSPLKCSDAATLYCFLQLHIRMVMDLLPRCFDSLVPKVIEGYIFYKSALLDYCIGCLNPVSTHTRFCKV